MKTKLPNSKHCFVCGLENDHGLQMTFYAVDENTIESHYAVAEKFQSYPGMVHGGIVASMLDEMITRVFMADDPERFVFTGKIEVKLRKHTPIGESLRLVGIKVRDRGRVGEARAELYGPKGDLLAEATGVVVGVPEGEFGAGELHALGWKVYPD